MKFVEYEKNNWVLRDDHDDSLMFNDIIELLESNVPTAITRLIEFASVRPQHIDALHHLGMVHDDLGENTLAYLYCQAAVSIGFQAMPDEFSWHSATIDWGNLDNRPFIRAYHALGLHYLNKQLVSEAATVFERLVSVCPNDNIGARYVLIACYTQLGEKAKIEQLCQQYPNEDLLSSN